MTRLPFLWRCRAVVACVIIPPLVNAISFATLARRLDRWRPTRNTRFDDEAAARWVTDILYRLPDLWYPTCLRRSAVLYYLLRRAGRTVHMYLGVQRGATGKIDAHAWLVNSGVPYLEPPSTNPSAYKVIARFPETFHPDAVDQLRPRDAQEG